MSSCKPLIRIYADMVADLFHRGHVEFLKSARVVVPSPVYLLVGIHADDVCASYKRKPIFSFEDRCSIVQACKYVDEVITGVPLKITEEFITIHRIDYVVHGDDMTDFMKTCYEVPINKNIMKYVSYYKAISTTRIIRYIKGLN